ncbi:MAG: tyrosine-type recombinase/integrase [Devosia marina]|uniref:tyrosine-type recombinase/integrase n=1 Tax=Devosia marina TaxID=2683198 RepID=UPI0032EB173C
MKQTLTTKSIDALKPAEAQRYEVRDIKTPGLHLRVSSTGAKIFCLSIRVDGQRRRIKIGPYPIVSLADARRRATEIARDIELGMFGHKQDATAPTLMEAISLFIDRYAKPNTKDWKGTRSILGKFASLGDTPIDEIRRKDVVAVLDGIVESGTPTRANRALAAFKKLMNWCINRGDIETSPVASLRPPKREIARDRVLEGAEIATLWKAADVEGFPFAQFVHMLILTGQRRGEVAAMRWSEIDFDDAIWTLPAHRSKNGRLHIVPLTDTMVKILESLPRFIGSDFVFTTTGVTPISGFGRLKERLDDALPDDTKDWRFHDFRRTASTGMAKLGVLPHVIDAVTNHKSGIVSGVAATYNRYSYLEEKREALERWGKHVVGLINQPRHVGTPHAQEPASDQEKMTPTQPSLALPENHVKVH